jgi:hypothetical protein
MAKKLIDHEEAARMLGVSVDELNSMRDRKQVFPKRDAGVWKYEQDQIERLIEERKSGSASWSDSLELDDLSLDTDPSSIVLSDDPGAGEGHSTKVGKGRAADSKASDVKLVTDPSGSDVQLVSGSSLKLEKPKSGSSGLLDDIGGSKSESDKLLGSSSLKLADDEIRATDSDSDRMKKKSGSDTRKGDSGLKLATEDDELVLDSKPDSDITVGGGDSGISLVDPHDSGLSLEQPLELEGSNLESFDLGEDDVISLDEDVAADEATHLKTEDDFLLTPMEEGADESDSGSQVIALEADEEFGGGFGSSPGLEEDLASTAPLVAPGLAPAAMAGAAALPAGYVAEPPFSAWNIVALVACFLFLFIGGMFMYDLVRHMWSWDSPYGFTSSMMDSLVKMLG